MNGLCLAVWLSGAPPDESPRSPSLFQAAPERGGARPPAQFEQRRPLANVVKN